MPLSLTPSSWSTGGLAGLPAGKLTFSKWPSTLTKPKLLLFMLAVFIVDQNPTVTPWSFSPVTWVCTECGKFSLW
jgi:hypothetical protein